MRKVSHYEAHWRDKRQAAVGASAADPLTNSVEKADQPRLESPETPTVATPPPEALPTTEAAGSPPKIAVESEAPAEASVELTEPPVEPDQPSSPDETRGDDATEEATDDESEEPPGTAPGDAAGAPSERRRRRRRDRRRQGGAAPAA